LKKNSSYFNDLKSGSGLGNDFICNPDLHRYSNTKIWFKIKSQKLCFLHFFINGTQPMLYFTDLQYEINILLFTTDPRQYLIAIVASQPQQ